MTSQTPCSMNMRKTVSTPQPTTLNRLPNRKQLPLTLQAFKLTWSQRAGLQLSDHVTKFSLQICAIAVLQGHEHALDINNPIALGIELTESLFKQQ